MGGVGLLGEREKKGHGVYGKKKMMMNFWNIGLS